ncbi:MAG: hypothetical protein V4694_03150 [Pseudomonadota bacterium]
MPDFSVLNIDELSESGKLDETLKELNAKLLTTNDSTKKSIIEYQIISIEAKKQKNANSGSVEPTQTSNDLSKNRDNILDIVNKGIGNESITNTAEEPNVTSLNKEILCFKDKEEFKSVKKAVGGIFDNLKEMGLDVRKTEVGEGEKSASLYAIRFPEAYKGQRDVMKLTTKEIDEIKGYYDKETPEQKQSVDASNYGIDALGHGSIITKDQLICDSLGLKKGEEKSAVEEEKEGEMAAKVSSRPNSSRGGR